MAQTLQRMIATAVLLPSAMFFFFTHTQTHTVSLTHTHTQTHTVSHTHTHTHALQKTIGPSFPCYFVTSCSFSLFHFPSHFTTPSLSLLHTFRERETKRQGGGRHLN